MMDLLIKTINIIQQFIKDNSAIQWRLYQNEYKLGASRRILKKTIALCSGDLIFLSDQVVTMEQ